MHFKGMRMIVKLFFTLYFSLVVTNISYAQHGRPGGGTHVNHPMPKMNLPVHINPPVINNRSHANSNSIYGTGNNVYNKKKTASDKDKSGKDKLDKKENKKKEKRKK